MNNDLSATTSEMKEITTLTIDYYDYYLTTLTTSDGTGNGLTTGSKLYETIYNGTNYWLASGYTNLAKGNTKYGIRLVYEGTVNGSPMYGSEATIYYHYKSGIRPVVYLAPDIELTGNSTDGWTIVKK